MTGLGKHPSPPAHDATPSPSPAAGIVVSGSRDIPRAAARASFERHLRRWLGGRRTWLVGGALGIDQWALEWLLEAGERVCVVVPFTAADQPVAVREDIARASQVIELHLPKTKAAFLQRNRVMVERATVVIGFPSHSTGGTVATLIDAVKAGKETHCFPIRAGDEDGGA